jgi:hypothetical protein
VILVGHVLTLHEVLGLTEAFLVVICQSPPRLASTKGTLQTS